MTEVDAVLASVAAYGLPGTAPAITSPLPEESWRRVMAQVKQQRLGGLAFAAAEGGGLPLTEGQADEVRDELLQWLSLNLLLERKLGILVDALGAEDIRAFVLKGPCFAHTVYPDPSWRVFGDLDVLVPTERFRDACGVLADLGHDRRLPEPRPGFDERFGKAVVHKGDDRFEVDLHRTLVLGPYSVWADPRRLIDEHTTFQLGPRTFNCLSPEHRFIHACMHAVLGTATPRLMAVRDAVQTSIGQELDRDKVERDVTDWRLGVVMARAARYAEERLRVDPGPILGSFRTRKGSRLEQRVLRSYVGAERNAGATAAMTLRAIPGVHRKVAYLAALVLPGTDFVARRNGGGPGGRMAGYRRRWRGAWRNTRRRIGYRAERNHVR